MFRKGSELLEIYLYTGSNSEHMHTSDPSQQGGLFSKLVVELPAIVVYYFV
jgi:hypothetical protein